jgi:hypothetical protein
VRRIWSWSGFTVGAIVASLVATAIWVLAAKVITSSVQSHRPATSLLSSPSSASLTPSQTKPVRTSTRSTPHTSPRPSPLPSRVLSPAPATSVSLAKPSAVTAAAIRVIPVPPIAEIKSCFSAVVSPYFNLSDYGLTDSNLGRPIQLHVSISPSDHYYKVMTEDSGCHPLQLEVLQPGETATYTLYVGAWYDIYGPGDTYLPGAPGPIAPVTTQPDTWDSKQTTTEYDTAATK